MSVKTCTLLVAGLASSSALAGGPYLAKGSFSGTGSCKTAAGLQMPYAVDLQLQGWSVERSERPDKGGAAAARTT